MQQAHVGGVIGFGGEEPVPQVLLNPTYGPIILGQPLALASMLNRLQAIAPIPLLTAADFEWGVGMRIEGATRFPRAMAFGAAGDEQLAFEAGRITARRRPRARRARQLRAGRRRQQQPAQSGDQHSIVRRGRRRVSVRWRPHGSAGCSRAACWPRSSIFPGMATPPWTRISGCR